MNKVKTIWRVLIALVQFPFVYRKLYDQVMHAIREGAKAARI